MNPSSFVFSRQSNLSAKRCVGIPQVWVLPTQDLQTAPNKEWENPELHSSVWWLSRLLLNWSVVKFHLPLEQQQHLVKTPSDASTESSTYFIRNCFSTKQQHEFLWAHHVVEDHGMPSELGGEGSGPALAANRPPLAVRKSETAAWDQAAVAGYKQLGQEHDC